MFGFRSADVTMATWGGSTQISAESVHDQSREAQSGMKLYGGLLCNRLRFHQSRLMTSIYCLVSAKEILGDSKDTLIGRGIGTDRQH